MRVLSTDNKGRRAGRHGPRRARDLARSPRVELALVRCRAGSFRRCAERVRSRPASGHRRRRRGGGACPRSGRRDGPVRRHAPPTRTLAHDRDARRLQRDAAPPRRARRLGGRGRCRGRAGRDDRPERRARARRGVRPPRRAPHERARRLRRPGVSAPASGGRPAAGSRGRPSTGGRTRSWSGRGGARPCPFPERRPPDRHECCVAAAGRTSRRRDRGSPAQRGAPRSQRRGASPDGEVDHPGPGGEARLSASCPSRPTGLARGASSASHARAGARAARSARPPSAARRRKPGGRAGAGTPPERPPARNQ